MSARALALSNDPVAQDAAQDYLSTGGSAVGAAITGFFAAAGTHAGVLLSPASLLVAGIGAGARAYDGRLRQPGLGAKRPRGFTDDASIPEQARVAVPSGLAAMFLAHAHEGASRLASIMKHGVQNARRAGSDQRADVLQRLRQAGASALSEPSFVRPMLCAAGPTEGGLLTPEDFSQVAPEDAAASLRPQARGSIAEVPWAAEPLELAPGASIGIGYALLAVDIRGTCAALAFRRSVDGFMVDDLELDAPLAAVPVERHVPRVRPGSVLSAPAPVAMLLDPDGTVAELIAAPGAERLDGHLLEKPPLRLVRDAARRGVQAIRG